MVAIYQTAYPRLKQEFSQKELDDIYTPTSSELQFALTHCKKNTSSRLGLLLQLKTVQRLGRFISLKNIPKPIIDHIRDVAQSRTSFSELKTYFGSGAKDRHVKLIRQYLNIYPYHNEKTGKLVYQWAFEAAKTKEALADIINVALEYLVKEQYELPPFSILQRHCQSARAHVNNGYYDKLINYLDEEGLRNVNQLLKSSGTKNYGWNELKHEAKKPTPRNIHAYIHYLEWLTSLQSMLPKELGLPPTKHRQYINEAKALDLTEIRRMKANKRTALVIVLIRHHYASTLDSAAQIVIKALQKMHRTAEKKLEEYLINHQKQTDRLVAILSGAVKVYLDKPKSVSAFDPVLGRDSKAILLMCEQYMAYAGNNYLPFMVPLYKKQRSALFRAIEMLNLQSASEDRDVLNAFEFISEHRHRRCEWLTIYQNPDDPDSKKLLNLRWIRDKWWKLVTGKTRKSAQFTHVNKLNLELCVFDRITEELGTGDLFIPHSETFDDYREQMISWEQYDSELPTYCEELGLAVGPEAFTQALQEKMMEACHRADGLFPNDEQVRIEHGKLIVGRPKRDERSPEIEEVAALLNERLEKINLLDVIINVERWLSLHELFVPHSGFESRIDDPFLRFVLTIFCYGTNIGPTETGRSVNGVSRKQIAWLNLKRTTIERLDKAIVKVNNAYKKFNLIECWGAGNSVSADGKLWDLYEDNLLSEYHLRHGRYGGIAYYHVSDTYIALFSHFIPCGVYEAVYILDGLLNDESEFKTDTVHGDTQAQSTPVFALAYLLGIKLMPRIRNIKDLTFYKPDKSIELDHIQSLFHEPIQWDRIQKHYPDMLRTAMSVKAGKMTASTILRRFGTKNRKNKLYYAFRELGRVVRTMFLLEYITDLDLRKTIQAATCKSEEFNEFARWLFFANGGKVGSNLKHEQGKIIKYNHLLANIAILYNVNAMTTVFNNLRAEGYDIQREHMARFSPYHTSHLGRLGSFDLDLEKEVIPIRYKLDIE